MQHAVRAPPHHIAGVEPAAPPSRLGRRLIPEIAREAAPARCLRRVAHEHLAGFTIRDVTVAIINDADIDAWHGPPKGARPQLARLDVVRKHTHHLGHAPDLNQRKAEARFKSPMQLRLDACADAIADLMASLAVARRLIEQQWRDHPEVVHDAGSRFGYFTPPALRR